MSDEHEESPVVYGKLRLMDGVEIVQPLDVDEAESERRALVAEQEIAQQKRKAARIDALKQQITESYMRGRKVKLTLEMDILGITEWAKAEAFRVGSMKWLIDAAMDDVSDFDEGDSLGSTF